MSEIRISPVTRLEGHAQVRITLDAQNQVERAHFNVMELRGFEKFLIGAAVEEAPRITARICGICPVAYQMSSVTALEKALGMEVSPQIYALRRLMYCGEYIESHALHIYLLQAPDLLGQPSALDLAAIAPEVVKNALRMKKIGNEILKSIGADKVVFPEVEMGQRLARNITAPGIIDCINLDNHEDFSILELEAPKHHLKVLIRKRLKEGRTLLNEVDSKKFCPHIAYRQLFPYWQKRSGLWRRLWQEYRHQWRGARCE
jgi:hypothetical protein